MRRMVVISTLTQRAFIGSLSVCSEWFANQPEAPVVQGSDLVKLSAISGRSVDAFFRPEQSDLQAFAIQGI